VKAIATVAMLLLSLAAGPRVLARAGALRDFPASDFSILARDGGQLIGRSHFEMTHEDEADVLRGESRYLDGQYDVEIDRFASASDGTPPALIRYDHRFFDASGAPLLVAVADFRTGSVSCVEYCDATPATRAATLEIAPGTWAGSSVLITIQEALRQGAANPLKLTYFNCAPGPRVLTVDVTLAREAHGLPLFPANAVEVGIRADFGIFNVVVAPFMPEIRAWFDASRAYEFLGAELPRYYGGPEIMMVPAAK
jgi:hypothetical protein